MWEDSYQANLAGFWLLGKNWVRQAEDRSGVNVKAQLKRGTGLKFGHHNVTCFKMWFLKLNNTDMIRPMQGLEDYVLSWCDF